jgi:intracellular sulfur oxidation DsrE/DsrF family protein
MNDTESDRRSFLHVLGAVLVSGRINTNAAARRSSPEPWLAGMHGMHKQFMDAGEIAGGKPLKRTHNFLQSYSAAYSMPESSINVLFGAHGNALALVCGDDLWNRLELGALRGIQDPDTHQPAVRNPFLSADRPLDAFGLNPESSLTGLQKRGVRMLACNNSIESLAATLAAQGRGSEPSLHAELIAGLLPGVMIVPAMLVAANRAQEEGFKYAFLT